MDFYVVIPARYDSSRFPGKVLTQIGDKTMLEHVYLNAMESNAKDVFIATDSNLVYEEAKKFTNKIYITSKKNKNGTERIAELVETLGFDKSTLVINLQADMPELQSDNINFLANKAKNNDGLSTLYYPLNHSKLKLDRNTVKINIEKNMISFHRIVKNNLSGKIYKHIGIYAYFVKDLYLYKSIPQSKNELSLSLEQYRFIDNDFKISAYCAISNPGISVDSAHNLNDI
jgi:3-deoxy-manno-octulosonate cytidylyltransferase (CMP-KDO synthetase)